MPAPKAATAAQRQLERRVAEALQRAGYSRPAAPPPDDAAPPVRRPAAAPLPSDGAARRPSDSAIHPAVAAPPPDDAARPPGVTLIAACSGGPDSTALLLCLARLRAAHGFSLRVAHLNHDFRGAEADADADFVGELAARLGLDCHIAKADPQEYQRRRGLASFEQCAREMRYHFLAGAAAIAGAAAVVTGHTADDQAETVLLHLLRGAGLSGLRGMSEIAPWPFPPPPHNANAAPGEFAGSSPALSESVGAGLPAAGDKAALPTLFRPLLSLSKADTAAYCRELGQEYRRDSGNYLWRFRRNRVRRDLLPRLARDYNPRIREALRRLAAAAAEESDFVAAELEKLWPQVAAESPGGILLRADALTAHHPALQRAALRRGYAAVAGDTRRLNERHLAAMLALLPPGGRERMLQLPRRVQFHRAGNVAVFTIAPGAADAADGYAIQRYSGMTAAANAPNGDADTFAGGMAAANAPDVGADIFAGGVMAADTPDAGGDAFVGGMAAGNAPDASRDAFVGGMMSAADAPDAGRDATAIGLTAVPAPPEAAFGGMPVFPPFEAADAPPDGEYALLLPDEPGDTAAYAIGLWRVELAVSNPGSPAPWPAAGPGEFQAALNRAVLGGGPAVVRTRRPGDRIQPAGMSGRKKLKDFFISHKVPRAQRDRIPLLLAGGRIAWAITHPPAQWAAPIPSAPILWANFRLPPPETEELR